MLGGEATAKSSRYFESRRHRRFGELASLARPHRAPFNLDWLAWRSWHLERYVSLALFLAGVASYNVYCGGGKPVFGSRA